MSYFVTDTHPLVWYITNQTRKLPRKVRCAFDDAVDGKIAIWVPMIVLWEFSLLLKAGQFSIDVPLEELIAQDFYAKAIHLVDLSPQDIVYAESLSFSSDPFDTLIVACAKRMECSLITGDSIIHAQSPCEVYW